MTQPLDPQLERILALAARAIQIFDDRALWKRDAGEAIHLHGAACDELWKELRDQVAVQSGQIPVLEHPSVKQRQMAKRLRNEIIAAVQGAVVDSLDDIISGCLHDETEGY